MNEKMYNILHEMIKARRDFWREMGNTHNSCSFADALDLIEYAHNNDIDAMRQFDFFPLDEEEEEDVDACMRESLGGG